MMKTRFKNFFPILIFFLLLNGMFITGRPWLARIHADQDVLIVGNFILFMVTLASFLLAQRGLANTNPNVFVRAIYGSVMIKLFVCMIAAFIYIASTKTGLNKPSLFTCMGLYMVYTFMEVGLLRKMLKAKDHA